MLLFDKFQDKSHFPRPADKTLFEDFHKRGLFAAVKPIAKYLVSQEAVELVRPLHNQGLIEESIPAGPAWIESTTGKSGVTSAILITDRPEDGVLVFAHTGEGWWAALLKAPNGLGAGVTAHINLTHGILESSPVAATVKNMMALEALILCQTFKMIDQPRVLAKEPREGAVSRQERRARERSGLPPLSSYCEVLIHLTKQEREARVAADEHEMRTGKRLHLCRSFLRVKQGKVERVREHWRGDASLGTKTRSHFKVVP